MEKDIRVERFNVCFKTDFGPVYAVRDANTVFESGKVTGMIGESGSGKSVLGMGILKLLASNAYIDGECWYGEDKISEWSETEMENLRGKEIALIPQNPAEALNPVIKIKKQLLEAVTVHDKAKKPEALNQFKRLMNRFGFLEEEAIGKKYSFELSGGMNQRVISVLGLMNRPKWVIADEPTKGLDAILRKQVYQVLQEIIEQDTKSMIVITHDVTLAQKLCDKILVLYKGEILEQGKTDLVLAQPLHPYTQGLVHALPSKGMIPIPLPQKEKEGMEDGCIFYARCEKSCERCRMEKPKDFSVEDGRKVRCFLYA